MKPDLINPPLAWFTDPRFTAPTPLVVTDDGRVYGHLAEWGVCHIGLGQQGRCVTAPESRTGYAYFRTGVVKTAEGKDVSVGQITLDTVHANEKLGLVPASGHYDHTGRAVADVAAGEDAYGIWIAGALRPGVTPAQVRVLRASPVSGDWREVRGNLELVAALSVNVQGFPIPRPRGLVAGGVLRSLVAGGMLAPRQVLPPGSEGALSNDDLRYLKVLAQRERANHAAQLRAKIEPFRAPERKATVEALAARVRANRKES